MQTFVYLRCHFSLVCRLHKILRMQSGRNASRGAQRLCKRVEPNSKRKWNQSAQIFVHKTPIKCITIEIGHKFSWSCKPFRFFYIIIIIFYSMLKKFLIPIPAIATNKNYDSVSTLNMTSFLILLLFTSICDCIGRSRAHTQFYDDFHLSNKTHWIYLQNYNLM